MQNFNFIIPTRIIFGKDAEQSVGSELKKHSQKVLLHYGGGSIKKIGLYDKVVQSLKAENIEFIELGGVQPNPRVSLVREGINICRENDIEFILAVGGGSVIDSAKAIAAGVGYTGDVWDLYSKGAKPDFCLPVATVLTIPAAGSETSGSTVITNDENNLKRGYGNSDLKPVFSILNPEITFSLPTYQTSCGLADMFAHVIERYFTNERHVDVTDRLCEAVMKSIIDNGRRVMKDPNDYHVRAEVMLAGMMAHSGQIDMGRIGDWASHNLEHELSGFYDIAHGAGLAIMIPAWMKYVYKHDIARFAQFGNRVFNLEINTMNPEETALLAIEELERFFRDINLPTRFSEADLPTHEIDKLAASLMIGSESVGNFVKIYEADAREIYKLAL